MHSLKQGLRVVMCLICCALAENASAEDKSDLTSMSLEQLMAVKVVSASKEPVKAQDAPANVEIITSDDIKRYGYRTLTEALRRIVGFNTYSLQYDFAFVRGFSVPGDFNTRILLLIDGHRINDNNYLQGYIGDEFPGDIEAIDHIEVSKGPGSAVWGTNAMLAVVNVVTKKGAQLGKGQASYEYGTGNRQKGFVASGQKIDDLEYTITSSFMDTNGDERIVFPPFEGQQFTAEDGDSSHYFHLNTGIKYKDLSVNLAHAVRRTQVPYAFYGVIPNDSGNFYNDDFTRLDMSYDTVVNAEDNSHFVARFYWDRNAFDGDYIYEGEEPGSRLVNSDRAVSELYGFEFRYSTQLTEALSVLLGTEVQDNYELSIVNYFRDPKSENFIDASEPYILTSPYAELQYKALDNLKFVAGVRGDSYTSLDDAATPRGAVIYSPYDTTTLRLMYGEGFRSSGNAERNYADNIATASNRDLSPERIRTSEASWQQRITEYLQTNLNVYYYTFSDLIYQLERDDGLFQYDNSDSDATSRGVELSALLRMADGINGYGGVTLFETRKDGARLVASPQAMANAGVSVALLDQRLFISPELRYVGSSNGFEDRSEVDSYIAANLNVLVKPFSNSFELSAGVYNLFDEEYYLPAFSPLYELKPEDGRTYRVQASYKFD